MTPDTARVLPALYGSLALAGMAAMLIVCGVLLYFRRK